MDGAAVSYADPVRVSSDVSVSELTSMLLSYERLPSFVEVSHAKPEHWTQLIHIAQTDVKARSLLVTLAQFGYYVCRAPKFGTRLVQHDHVANAWKAVADGTYSISDNGTVYKLSGPRHGGAVTSLLVVFSMVATNRFTQLLDRHFAQGFPGLEKSVSGHTAVLRIADLDGVVGGYYMSTVRDPDVPDKIESLIADTARKLGVPMNRVVFYGASKGATGALYMSLRCGVEVVAVDPIVSTVRRRSPDVDPYFVGSEIFPMPLEEQLDLALHGARSRSEEVRRAIVTSRGSAEFGEIVEFASRAGRAVSVVESRDPHISAHHLVAPNSVAITLALINAFTQGLDIVLPRYCVVD